MARYQSKRISKEDEASSVSKTNAKTGPATKKGMAVTVKSTVVTIDIQGKEVVDLPESETFAKRISSNHFTQCYIRVNRRNRPADPHDRFDIEESLRIARLQGTEPYRLVQCPTESYENYVIYLKTKSKRYLQYAGRGI